MNAPWPGNVRQLRNLIESMVVLAPGAEIRAADIPADILEGPGTLLPVLARGSGRALRRAGRAGAGVHPPEPDRAQAPGGGAAAPAGRAPQRVQVIEVADHATRGRRPAEGESDDGDGPVVYRHGMTMAEVEKAAIEAALQEYRGNRRQAARGPGHRRADPVPENQSLSTGMI